MKKRYKRIVILDNFLRLWEHFLFTQTNEKTDKVESLKKKELFFEEFTKAIVAETDHLKHYEKPAVYYKYIWSLDFFELKDFDGSPFLRDMGFVLANFLFDNMVILLHTNDVTNVKKLLERIYEIDKNSSGVRVSSLEIGRKFLREASSLCVDNKLETPFYKANGLGSQRRSG